MLTDLIYRIAGTPQEKSLYTGVRKIVQGVTYEMTELPKVNLEQLGYRGGKIRQLMRNYFNDEEVEAAKTKLAARRKSPHTSIALNTLGQNKDTRSQGHCIRSIVITQTPHWTEVDILYRSTEIIQKHMADYALIPMILERAGLAHTPRVYRLYFANVFLTALFAPLLFQHTDPIKFYEFLRARDPKYFKTFLNATAKFYEKECRYSYKHRVKMWDIAQRKLNCYRLSEYCLEHGASFNPEGRANSPLEEDEDDE